MMDLPLDTKGKRPAFFEDPAIDCVMTALLEVMAENWTLKERMLAMEKALITNGTLSADDIEAVEWTAEEAAEHAAMRQRSLEDAFRALNSRFHSIPKRKDLIDSESFEGE